MTQRTHDNRGAIGSTAPLTERIGFYHWGGPGTIRMIHVKYFNARVDHHSLMTCYDYDYLAQAQERFGITDCWVTYSWGFADATEAEDRAFILDRLDNFKRLGIRTHAYIQGPNLVYRDFPDKDWWTRDEHGRPVTYYRGRWMCSIYCEDYVRYVVDKIEGTHGLGFDGVFVDNIQNGQLGTPTRPGDLPFVFCGDASRYARDAFRSATGLDIPADFEKDPSATRAYLDFRINSNAAFVAKLSDAAHRGGLEFGTNFYDPKFDPNFVYGIDLEKTAAPQDYVLFENHSLPATNGKRHNAYIERIVDQYYPDKPVFVVSYENGIGMAPQFTQEQIDNLFSEAAVSNFLLCLKGGEFTTRRRWHCLYLDQLATPRRDKILQRLPDARQDKLIQFLIGIRPFRKFLKRYFNPITRISFEWRSFRIVVKIVYDLFIK